MQQSASHEVYFTARYEVWWHQIEYWETEPPKFHGDFTEGGVLDGTNILHD